MTDRIEGCPGGNQSHCMVEEPTWKESKETINQKIDHLSISSGILIKKCDEPSDESAM